MENEKAVFLNNSNKELFRSQNVVGKKLKIVEYKRLFKNKNLVKILEDDSINETVNAFIKGSLNLAHASTSSFVHRNTLIYRIDKVNRLIGLDLRQFEDCLIFVNMREIYKMMRNKENDV